MKSKKNKSLKLLALSTAVCTAIGATSVITSVDAFASSITQESGNDTRGKLEIVTNPFKTFEDAKDFLDNTLKSILTDQAYRTSIVPSDFPNIEKGYVLITVLSYNSETFSKSEAEALANKVIAVADVTITGNNLSGTIKPKEEGNALSGTIKPKEEGNVLSGTIKPKEEGDAPSGVIKSKEESNVPSGTIKSKEEGKKPSKSLEDKNKLDTKLKEDKINKSINKSEGDLGKKETKSVLPRTGETTSSLLLIGVIMAGLGISFAVKRKQG